MKINRNDLRIGTLAWAAYGTTRWSAVKVVAINNDNTVTVERSNYKTNAISGSGVSNIDQLIVRDPAKRGLDRPSKAPAELFERAAPVIPEVAEQEPNLLLDEDQKTRLRRFWTWVQNNYGHVES